MKPNKILSLLCALALTGSALALSACNSATGEISVASSATGDSSATGESSSAISATGGSSTTETTAPPDRRAEDYVKTEAEYEIDYKGTLLIEGDKENTGDTSLARLPQLTIDSADAKAINKEIHEKFDKEFAEYEKDNGHVWMRIDYAPTLNGKVLSLAIESRTADSPASGFVIYNIDVETGKALSYQDIAALAGLTIDEANAYVIADINARCDETEAKLTDDNLKAQLKEVREKSVSDENMAKNAYYLDEDGKLTAAYRYYWIAGGGIYGALVKTDAVYQG